MTAKKIKEGLALSVICAINPKYHIWSSEDLADLMGVSPGYIRQIEMTAKNKLRNKPTYRELLECVR